MTQPNSPTFKDLPDVDDDTHDLINGLFKQLAERQPRNLIRASFYDGKYALKDMGSIIPPEYLRTATVLGWSAKAVDTLARRCNLDAFVWPDGDLESIGGDDVWADNFFAAESNSAIVSSLIHGPAYLVNTAGGADEPDSLIHVKDALSATGEWNARTRRMDNLLSVTERDDKGNPTSFALYEDGVTLSAELDEDTGKWVTDISTHKLGVPVEMLVYHPRVGRPFGQSRISRPVMSLHKRALKTCIRMDAHADVYSFPQMILLGADAKNFKNSDGSLKPAWQVALARIFMLPDDDDEPDAARARADVKQFPAQSPQPHIELLEQIAQMFSGETSIPVDSLGITNRANPTSADAYIASREDLIAEAEGATDDWAPAFRRSFARALAIRNNENAIPDAWKTIDTQWRSPIYLSRAAAADAGAKQLAAGPEWLKETEVGLELLGLSKQQIDRAIGEKRVGGVLDLVQALTAPPAPVAEDQAVGADQQQAADATVGSS